jgi:hypothetical protein
MITRVIVISERKVVFPHSECNFPTQCDFDTQECDYDTHDCDFNTHKCDFFTQSPISTRRVISTDTSVILTRMRVISVMFTRAIVISEQKVLFPHSQSVISTRRV